MTHPRINILYLTVSKIWPRQNFKGRGHYNKVKSRSHYVGAYLQPLTNVSIRCQLPTPYGFLDIARTGFSSSRSLQQGQRSNQGHILKLHT